NSAAIHASAASSSTFLPIACTPASRALTVPESAGRERAFSESSANRDSKVFTGGKPRPFWSSLERRVRARELAQRERGRDGRLDSLAALVLRGSGQPRAIERLGLVVARQDAEPDGDARAQRDLREAVRRGGAHEVEVRRPAPDDDAERHDG